MDRRLILSTLLAAITTLACAAPSLVPTAEPLPSPSPTWTLLPAASPTARPSATLAPTSQPAVPTATRPPATSTAVAFTCPNAPAPRVEVGDRARVTFTDGLPLRVRETPQVGNNVIAQIAEGTTFAIIGGPECAPIPDSGASFVFWEIEVEAGGLTGWVAEGSESVYYIEIVP